ncbi:MAG: hypothetical protein M1352_02180 [Patescibacteria group bacterium]|nr:hypothetical protein [Patescibacteria group bacterium]
MSKRNRFLLFTIVLTFLLTLVPIAPKVWQFPAVIALAVTAVLFALLNLFEFLEGIEFFTLLAMAGLLTLGMGATLLHFPNFSLAFRIVFYGIFFVLYYTTILSMNIFNVANEQPIPLLRAAYTAAFLVTVFCTLPLFTVLYKFYWGLLWDSLVIFAVAFILSFQSLWTVFLPREENRMVFVSSLIVALILTETSIVFSFFPLETFFRSLTLSAFFYIYLGFAHQHLKKTLTLRNVAEYFLVGILVVLGVFLY